MDLGLEHQRVIVTGAGGGIGSAIMRRLLEEGAYAIGIDLVKLEESELRGLYDFNSRDFDYHKVDASNRDEVTKVLENYNNNIWGLVNNAGYLGADSVHGGRTDKAWDKMMDSHARSAYTMTELCVPKMHMGDGGAIVNMGSIELDMAAPDVVLYTAAKGALYGMTMSYAVELADKNITVNNIAPGSVSTEKNKAQFEENSELIRCFKKRTPLGREVNPEEVADLTLFLLSKKARAITGAVYNIDCGYRRALWDPEWASEHEVDGWDEEF